MNMKTTVLNLLNIAFLSCTAHAVTNDYRLVWADEFNIDGKPNPGNWIFEHGHVRNNEAQWYQPENAACTNGLLVIEARREKVPNINYEPGSKDWRKKWRTAGYTSACLKTRGLHSWTHGRFVMRAKIDVRPGMWPAFWTLGNEGRWPHNGEIDIMEYYKDTLLANAFWWSGKTYHPHGDTSKTPLAELGNDGWAEQFHVWRMDWDEDAIRLYVDDRLLNTIEIKNLRNPAGSDIKRPFHQPHYILVNLAVGGTCGGDPSETEFPARYEIDYVRVYQK
jgi:beta-glucanase (GH16 family)